jgi:hypothetical protein
MDNHGRGRRGSKNSCFIVKLKVAGDFFLVYNNLEHRT